MCVCVCICMCIYIYIYDAVQRDEGLSSARRRAKMQVAPGSIEDSACVRVHQRRCICVCVCVYIYIYRYVFISG